MERLTQQELDDLRAFVDSGSERYIASVSRDTMRSLIGMARGCIPHDSLCFFKDGGAWCCVYGDFINLQESPVGFGDTFEQALDALRER